MAEQSLSNGQKQKAQSALDLAEMELELLDDAERPQALARFEAFKKNLQNPGPDPQRRENLLSSLQRRAENIKLRLQNQSPAWHEIEELEQYANRAEHQADLNDQDQAQLKKQIEGFKRLSQKYQDAERLQELAQMIEYLERHYHDFQEAVRDENQYQIEKALDYFMRDGQRLEKEMESFSDEEVLSPLKKNYQSLKDTLQQNILELEEAKKRAEAEAQQNAEAEARTQADQEALQKMAFWHLPSEIPPPPQTDEDGKLLGRIVFSDQPIQVGQEEVLLLKNHFTAGENLFGMAYFADTRKNIGFERGVKLSIFDLEDGRGLATAFDLMQPFVYKPDNQNQHARIYDLDIFVRHAEAWDKELTAHLLQMLWLHLKNAPQSPFGDNSRKIHHFRVEIEAGYQTVARGDFHLDLRQGHEKIAEMYQTHTQAALQSFKLPDSKRFDPDLAEKITQIMVADGVEVQKVVFSTADWGMIRHELSGTLLRRSIWAYVVYKNEKGECHYDDIQFTEEFIGNDFCGTIRKAGYGTAHGQILCENI